MTYAQTLEYIYTRLPMFSRQGAAAYRKDLNNIRALCEALNNPQDSFPTLHIAGTNGKGSVSHMTASVFQCSGYKTGLYTSPHLYDFRERIKINGEMIPEEKVIQFIELIKPRIDELSPSFFELSFAMALHYFREEKVDMAIIETGLGGRLDSTNIITPLVSVITNIGWDHMNLLGNSLEEIATEKAGIIKEGVPVILGEWSAEAIEIIKKESEDRSAPLILAEDAFEVTKHVWVEDDMDVEVFDKRENTLAAYMLDLPGIYQTKNLVTTLTLISAIKGSFEKFNPACIREGLQNAKANTKLFGRWEVIQRNPWIVLEVAHNIDGISQMLAQIDRIQYDVLHIVFGTVKDKDPLPILRMLPPTAKFYYTQATIPRALPAIELGGISEEAKRAGETFDNVNAAVEAASSKAGKQDLIVVCGSIFVVAEVDREKFSKNSPAAETHKI